MAVAAHITNSESMRARLEEIIERGLELLNQLDGDCDLEDGADDEPSLTGMAQFYAGRYEADLELDKADLEPSLGWPNPGGDWNPELIRAAHLVTITAAKSVDRCDLELDASEFEDAVA